jgi:hypothetical protein
MKKVRNKMSIEDFRKSMAYTTIEATETEKKETRSIAQAIIKRNKALFTKLASL